MKRLQIFNVRFGFATNSSSTHSLLFLPENHNINDDMVEEEDFGWQYFTAISENAKRRYLAHTLRHGITAPENISNLVTENWSGTQYNLDGYIDHQSLMNLPLAFGSKFPDEQFFKELLQWVLQPNLAILGGNDNMDDDDPNDRHPLGFGFALPLDRDGFSNIVCRKEKDYWILFDRGNGTRIRFRFCNNKDEMIIAPQKPSAPELIDLKLTNFCPYNCPMCYQNSSVKKEEENDTYHLGSSLAALKVFEVAIGGGEPTWAKHFKETIRHFHGLGITCNFSTRNLDWLRNPSEVEQIIPYTGAFAYSLIGPNDLKGDKNKVKELFSLLNANGILQEGSESKKTKASLHAIVGPKCFEMYDIQSLLNTANEYDFPITLLGFKQTGRGADVKVEPNFYKGLIKEIKTWRKQQKFASPIGIDTTLASYLQKELKEEGISDLLYTTKEGVYSCYIDMTQNKIGPSSYCSPEQMMPVENNYWEEEAITKAFARF